MSMLSRGAIDQLLSAACPEQEPQQPVLQVIEIKPVGVSEAKVDRYRLMLTDGVTTISGMLAQQLHSLVSDGQLRLNNLIRLSKYHYQSMGTSKVIILLDIEILEVAAPVMQVSNNQYNQMAPQYNQQNQIPAYGNGGQQSYPSYGNTNTNNNMNQNNMNIPAYGQNKPVSIPSYGQNNINNNIPAYGQSNVPNSSPSIPSYGGNNNNYGGNNNSYGNTNQNFPNYGQNQNKSAPVINNETSYITPISVINPYSNKWTIKARVTNKSELRTWSNAKGEGTLFTINLLDNVGTEIRATFFKDAATKFFPLLEENKVFTFSGGKVKTVSNPQYNTVKNNYEITFDQNSEIRPCADEGGIKAANYNFVKIPQIMNLNVGDTIDVIGVISKCGEVSEIRSTKLNGKELRKKDIFIFDESNMEIRVTLWGDKTSDPRIVPNEVVALKGVKIGEYQGRNLGTTSTTSVMVSPDSPDAHLLLKHIASPGFTGVLTPLSGEGGSFSSAPEPLERRKLLSAVREDGAGGDKGDYLSVKATVNYIRHENDPWYTACPTKGCNKKVVDMGGQGFHCEKCNNTFDSCEYRYILSMTVIDTSGQQWVSAFNDVGDKILNTTAKSIHEMKEQGLHEEVNKIYSSALFKTYIMKTRAKMENVNDEQRLKCTVLKVDEVDWRTESAQLIEAIKKFSV